jgi:adenine-specific DNA-methyltransferase
MTKEQKFYKALEDLFIGAKIEGEGGFVNLMRIKSSYYSKIREHLEKDIEKALEKYPKFREELFDKLYSFFSRYFTKSGSIYFNYTPFFQNVYDKVYTDDKDVILFWKTRMLYYVKTDRIFRNLKIEIEDKNETYQFFFDVSNLEYKKANEKRSLIYELKKVSQDSTIFFNVFYSEKGRQTKYDDIKKELKQKRIKITDEVLDKAFSTFEAQSEVDYFINKNAKEFLQEQFKIWLYQYIYSEETEWPKERIDELQILKDIAFKIIDFISQFEDELVKIWEKPKFVLNSNYVITLDRIAKKNGFEIIEKIQKHKNFKDQIKEWKELGILEKEPGNLLEKTLTGLQLKKEYQFLPIDTKYFKDLELEILSLFDDLDQSLDGWLIKSENYQALNTILPKFREKVQMIYIDPPFNTGDDFPYVDRFQDSSWLSLMYDRINLGYSLLRKEGNFFYHIDRYAYYYSRIVLNSIFGDKNFKAEIAWDTCGITGFKPGKNNWVQNINYILHFSKDNENNFFKKPFIILEKEEKERLKIGWLDLLYDDEKDKYYIEKWNNNDFVKEYIETRNKKHAIGMVWNDIYSFLFTQVGNNESFFFNTQKPEHLLRRIIQSSSNPSDIVCDFFSGIGTTLAVAHKLNRKWLGIEMGSHFETIYLDTVTLKKKKNQNDQDDLSEDEIEEDDPSIVEVLSETKGQKTVIMKKIGIVGRMKIVLSGDQIFHVFSHPRHPQLSRNINWQGGGFFKYYELEQYEDVLRKAKYEDSDLFSLPNQSPYEQYIFLKDKKLLDALEIDYKSNKVKVDLSKIYSNIDIAETLSNLKGKWIKRITENEVELADYDEEGKAKNIEKVDLKNLDYKEIKKLIWW